MNRALPLFVGLVFVAHTGVCRAQGRPEVPPALTDADVRTALIKARALYLADGAGGKSNPRTLMYVHQREGINHTPLLAIAIAQAFQMDAEVLTTVEAIEDPPVRAYSHIRVAKIQLHRGEREQAKKSLDRAIALLKAEAEAAAPELWSHVLSAVITMHGDLETAKAEAKKSGCPWDVLDNEERQHLLAQYHVSKGDLAAARKALNSLPADSFAKRRGQQALANDDGAGFYAWIGKSVTDPQAYTAEHVLLEWIQDDGKPEQMESVLAHLDDPMAKIAGYLRAAGLYHDQKKPDQSKAAFARAEAIVKTIEDPQVKSRLEVALVSTQLELDGHSAADAIRKSMLIDKYGGEPWLLMLIPVLLECNELALAEEIAAKGELDDRLHGYFVVALTKAKRHEEADAHLKQVKDFMARPRTLMGLALQHNENGDSEAAKAAILEAIKLGKEIKSTNKWFPDAGEVRLRDKWQLMTDISCAAVQMGYTDIVLETLPAHVSVRRVAQVLGRRRDQITLGNWIDKFSDQDRAEGSRAFAWLGFAEGLSAGLAKD